MSFSILLWLLVFLMYALGHMAQRNRDTEETKMEKNDLRESQFLTIVCDLCSSCHSLCGNLSLFWFVFLHYSASFVSECLILCYSCCASSLWVIFILELVEFWLFFCLLCLAPSGFNIVRRLSGLVIS